MPILKSFIQSSIATTLVTIALYAIVGGGFGVTLTVGAVVMPAIIVFLSSFIFFARLNLFKNFSKIKLDFDDLEGQLDSAIERNQELEKIVNANNQNLQQNLYANITLNDYISKSLINDFQNLIKLKRDLDDLKEKIKHVKKTKEKFENQSKFNQKLEKIDTLIKIQEIEIKILDLEIKFLSDVTNCIKQNKDIILKALQVGFNKNQDNSNSDKKGILKNSNEARICQESILFSSEAFDKNLIDTEKNFSQIIDINKCKIKKFTKELKSIQKQRQKILKSEILEVSTDFEVLQIIEKYDTSIDLNK